MRCYHLAVTSENRLLPSSTYRLQCSSAFAFDQARELLPYLQQLGISGLYTSPLQNWSQIGTASLGIVEQTN